MAKTLGSLAIGEVVELPVKKAYQSYIGEYIPMAIVADQLYLADSKLLWADKLIANLPYDAKETNEPYKNGNGIWSKSCIKLWLNSEATEGKWFESQSDGDQPPNTSNIEAGATAYTSWAGFLHMLDEKILPYIGVSKYKSLYVKDEVLFNAGVAEMSTKVFLPSYTELGAKISLMQGEPIPEAQNRSKKTSDFWGRSNSVMSNQINGIHMVMTLPVESGSTSSKAATYNGGIRPMMSLLNTFPVSSEKNERGNYIFSTNNAPSAPTGIVAPETCYSNRPLEISWGTSSDLDGDSITYQLERSVNNASYTQVTSTAALRYTESNVSKEWNTLQYRVRAYDGTDYSPYITSGKIAVIQNRPPVLTGEDGDLGEKSINVSYRYTVTDPDGDSVTITETVDSKTLRTYTARLGEENELDISGDSFMALSIGAHTVTITARDASGNTATRTLTFTKTITGFSITLREPLQSETIPKRCFVNVSREIPFGALFRVEACNNPNDTSPVWEDITAAVLASHVHVFANDSDHGLQHGLNIRVTVERNNGRGECWIGGIGGNFE